MKVDMAQTPGIGDLKVKTGTGSFISSLKEGDSIKAEVLSSNRGIVAIKTNDGHLFKARTDPDVTISPGDKVTLEMVGKEAETVFLSIADDHPAAGGYAGQAAPVQDFSDKTLLPYAMKLAELYLPVTEENARLIRELLAQNSGMNPDEAAFIAANKLAGDKDQIAAALSLFSSGEKTDAMLERLVALLQDSEHITPSTQPEGERMGAAEPRYTERVLENAEPANEGGIIAPDSELRSSSSENIVRYNNQNFERGQQSKMLSEAKDSETGMPVSAKRDQNSERSNVGRHDDEIHSTEEWRAAPLRYERPVQTAAHPNQSGDFSEKTDIEFEVKNTEIGNRNLALDSFDAHSEEFVPEEGLRATTKEAAQHIRNEPYPEHHENLDETHDFKSQVLNSELKTELADFIEKTFIRVEKNDRDMGMRLRNAKEELFERLLLMEETISRSEQPAKSLIIDQTRRIIDHVRLLNDVNQFAYMQIPLQIGDYKKAAELYILKNKAGKRFDPENVNILLALDLENMGHWEGLINIRNKDVSIKMEVQGQKEKEHFSENTVLLHELLGEAGFRLVNTDIKNSEKETTPLTVLSVFARHTSSRTGIDFTI